MDAALAIAHGIDRINGWWGRIAVWAMFISCMVSAGNATVRYLINLSSNAWLEIQWYLFAVCVLMGAAAVLKVNEHVRVDVMYSRYSPRGQGLGRSAGHHLLHDAGHRGAGVDVVALVPGLVEPHGALEQRGRADPLAGQDPDSARLLLPDACRASRKSSSGSATCAAVYAMDTHYERPLQ